MTGDALESRLLDDAFVRRVTKRLRRLERGADPDLPPPENIDFTAFVDRVIRRFASEGWRLTADEAANLCVCFVLSPALLLTGAPGSGKSTAARLLAEALGAGIVRVRGDAAKKRPADCPTVYVVDDANRAEMPDPLHGLGQELVAEHRVIATLQDAHSGVPVSAPVWDSGFAVRLTPPDDLPWQPAARSPLPPETPVSIARLAETMPLAEVPAAAVERMEQLRVRLRACGVGLSRRALNDAWRYTAAMTALTDGSADAGALPDRAFAQRLLPALLSAAPVEALIHLKALLKDMPACLSLLSLPLPIRID